VSLIAEDGTGVAGAESYATTAYIDTYWAARGHRTSSATWATATTADKEGAAREASAYIDATWGVYYKGRRAGYNQGLLWPRIDAMDEAGYPLPDLPDCLKIAVAELAVRSLSAVLQADQDTTGDIKSLMERVGPIETQTVYVNGGIQRAQYGSVAGILFPVLNGLQPELRMPQWSWS
jgi:hypothetical protein